MAFIESYEHVDMGGNHIALELYGGPDGWKVICYQGPDEDSMEFHWEAKQKITKMDPTGNRILEAIPFDEALAREEFERWRPK